MEAEIKTATVVKAISITDNVLSIKPGEEISFPDSDPASVRNVVFSRVLDKCPAQVYSTSLRDGIIVVRRDKDLTRAERNRIESGETRRSVLKDRKIRR